MFFRTVWQARGRIGSELTIDTKSASASVTRAYYADFLLHYESETVLKENDNIARTIYYTYDDDGNRATAQYPSNEVFKYDYTGRGQLADIYDQTIGGAAQVSYTHDLNGNRTLRTILGKNTWSDPNFTTYQYDSVNRLLYNQHAWSKSQSNWTRAFNYGYDATGNRTYEMRDWGQQGDGFQYDLAGQTIGYQREGTVNTSTGAVSGAQDSDTLGFDPSGNRTTVVDDGATTTYATANALNQYPSINGAGLSYDGNGNLAGYNGYTFTYNALNQLAHVGNGTNSGYFWYDGLGRICVSQLSNTTGLHVNFYDGWNLVEEYRLGNSLDARYLYGEGELVSRRSGGQTHYYYQDGRGNTSQVADANAMVLENYKYQLNGAPLIYDPNGVQLGATAIDNRFLFGGQEYFSDLGLINLRHRFYLPALGRFLQPDPIGFSGDPANIYRYCGNNPTNESDPSGFEGYLHLGDVVGPISPSTLTYDYGMGAQIAQWGVYGAIGGFSTKTWQGVGVGAILGAVAGTVDYIWNTPYPDQNPQPSQGGTGIQDFGQSPDITSGQSLPSAPSTPSNESQNQNSSPNDTGNDGSRNSGDDSGGDDSGGDDSGGDGKGIFVNVVGSYAGGPNAGGLPNYGIALGGDGLEQAVLKSSLWYAH